MIRENLLHSNIRVLIADLKNGDHAAFEKIINDYRKLVIHIIFRIVKNTADREDLFQDIFIKVFKNIQNFRFQSKLSTWIGKIAYNTCVNHLKRNRTEEIDENILTHTTENFFSDPQPLPDSLMTQKDMTAQVHKEIKKLNYIYRTVLTLFHLEEMSYKEISDIMNIPQGSVKSYLFRARKELKDRLISKI